MTKKIQFTQDGFDRIVKEREELITSKKEKAIDRLQKARAMGDLSENSEYTAAKEDLGFIEGRVRELDEVIRNAEIVETKATDTSVEIGSKVTVDVNGKQDEFMLVGDFEANPMEKKLSQTSPIGKALMGKKKGDAVEIDVPAGKIKYTILEIKQN